MKRLLLFLLCFTLLFSSVASVVGAIGPGGVPGIIYVPWMLKPGDVGSVFGGYMGTDKASVEIAIQPLTGFSGTLSASSAAYKIKPFMVVDNLVQFEIPSDIPYDVYAIWVKNAKGWSEVSYTNKAQIFWVNEHEVYSGQKLTIAGRNIANPLDRSSNGTKVQFVPVGGGTALDAPIYDISDYSIYFNAPKDLETGKKYNITYTNGAGGEYGVTGMLDAEREVVTAVASNANTKFFDDNYDLNISWFSTIDTTNVVNVKDQGAAGDGKKDDTAAIQKALDAVKGKGGIVYFPEGTYLMSQVYIGENTAIRGDGPDKTLLKWDGKKVEATPRTILRRQAWPNYYEPNILLYSDSSSVGVFDVKIEGIEKRPADVTRAIYGWFAPIGFLGGFNAWDNYENQEIYPEGVKSPRSSGYVLSNVHIKTNDGSGPVFWSEKNVIIDNCNFDLSHQGFEIRGTSYARVTNNTIKNVMRPLMYFIGDQIDGRHVEGDRAYVENNLIIGDSLKRKVQEGTAEDPGWNEFGATLEHRVTDLGGDENLFINNTVEGKVADNSGNEGEGVQTQSQNRKLYDTVVSADETSIKTGRDLAKVYKNFDYITIVAGPGIGQLRKVVDCQGDVIVVDKPWDVMPTSESKYTVDSVVNARNLWVNNEFNASNAKGSFHFYCKDYDSVVANNVITDGGGIWYSSSVAEDGIRCDFSYFLTVFNNSLTGWSNPKHPQGQATVIGPGNDGGIATSYNATAPCTSIYGTRIIHNTILGMTTDPVPNKDFNAMYALNSGIFISTPRDVSYPCAMGEIVDGNKVSNTVAGVHLSNTAYYTVLRNNDFKGNAKEINEPSPSVGTTTLTGSNSTPGKMKLEEINVISSSTPTTITLVIDSTTAVVNGENFTLDVPAMVINDRTLTPARFVAEKLGATVDWDEETKTVTITSGTDTIILVIDSNVAIVNGVEKFLDVPAMVINDRTLTPARFVAENLGATVGWDEETMTVSIVK